ncbi:hypothetical protein ABEB36_015451 [Hypothenemus hampei]|uniref:Tf2-1-like SH3-like domain-containing protein n=1 Tax=Hypothenemus hampei TaxID=57062 RepID=A0ABD1E0K6_HYPHA
MRTLQELRHDFSVIVQTENFIPAITPYLRKLAKVLKEAKNINEGRQDYSQNQLNLHRRDSPKYNPGDRVWVETHPISKAAKGYTAKFAPRRDGPYIILQQLGTNSYEIADPNNPTIRLGTYHSSALREYKNEEEVLAVRPIKRRGRPKIKKSMEEQEIAVFKRTYKKRSSKPSDKNNVGKQALPLMDASSGRLLRPRGRM